jgi:hypothetical protein
MFRPPLPADFHHGLLGLMDDLRPRGPGRFVLQGLAIVSALGFLGLVMVQAMAFYAPLPPAAPKTRTYLLAPATKDAPVVLPPPLVQPQEQLEQLDLFPATKAGTLGRLRLSRPAPAPQRQGTPHP